MHALAVCDWAGESPVESLASTNGNRTQSSAKLRLLL
eukprot:CAMPEP_0174301832 /NCGR_PEP_ID=MMETSP0809-20121228/59275_1 /TAXON_ID=73025 ORGANISM="Eutreptiella gymnastica-like, Strain CCMP1594" /NCGR_SAMPLE_ID=MMETSP0809 /ASSEMBLY_ACC=CAM_ASM_000658 /LENGTH=36 /DNA_ID= /DNA_START= /DNA_END= /DNA_ORIENTATION=